MFQQKTLDIAKQLDDSSLSLLFLKWAQRPTSPPGKKSNYALSCLSLCLRRKCCCLLVCHDLGGDVLSLILKVDGEQTTAHLSSVERTTLQSPVIATSFNKISYNSEAFQNDILWKMYITANPNPIFACINAVIAHISNYYEVC